MPELVFGRRTGVLLIFALQGFVVAVLLMQAKRNRVPNRFLAALMAHLAWSLGQDIIGFAGLYDRWPWLTFAPFEAGLLTGPLFYLYVSSLTRGTAPAAWRRHLLAPALELLYRCVCFALPLTLKSRWWEVGHGPFVEPLLTVGSLISMSTYLIWSVRDYQHYQRWLADNTSFSADLRLPWLRAFLTALALLLVLTLGFVLFSVLVRPLDYWGWFWLHLALAVMTYALGLAGWRAAEREFPAVAATIATPEGRDWAAMGAAFEKQVRDAEWWRDAQLTLRRLAERLTTSEGQLSRALNQGLGVNFNEFVNGLRVEAVSAALRDPGESRSLLVIALDCGFSSKASFNRAFKAATGTTPSAFRKEVGTIAKP